MFIFILTYQKPLSEVEKDLEAHREYLDANYSIGKFIASGRQEPRVGGVILCRASSREEAEALVHSDPFYIHQIASYQIIEFIPTKHLPDFDKFI